MKKLKGGIESIIAIIILVGLLIALIVAVVIPMMNKTTEVGQGGINRMDGLAKEMRGEK